MTNLNLTTELVLTLEVDSLNLTKWLMDASYTIHQDMKSDAGVVKTFDKGPIHSQSAKQS